MPPFKYYKLNGLLDSIMEPESQELLLSSSLEQTFQPKKEFLDLIVKGGCASKVIDQSFS